MTYQKNLYLGLGCLNDYYLCICFRPFLCLHINIKTLELIFNFS